MYFCEYFLRGRPLRGRVGPEHLLEIMMKKQKKSPEKWLKGAFSASKRGL
jgi:hypothetical protein